MVWQAVSVALVYGMAASWAAELFIERAPVGERLRGPRRCATCAAPLAWDEQFPVIAWLPRHGRCRACGADLGRRWLIGLACVLGTGGIVALDLPGLTVIPWLLFVPVAVALGVIDMREKRLPDALTLPAAGGALVLLGIDAGFHDIGGLGRAVVSSLMLFAVYFLMNLLSRGGMGMGDVKLALSIGALTGYLGWVYTVGATMIAFLLGGVLSTFLLASRRTDRKATIPFGPFMLVGAFACLPLGSFLASFLAP